MGLLDDLKQQAEGRKQQLQASQATRDQKRQAVHAALREVSRYLTELADSLNVLKPQVLRYFYVDGPTQLDQLMQYDYMARDRRQPVDNQDYLEEASLRFRCVGSRNQRIQKETPAAIKNLRDYLWGYNLRFECQEIKNDRGLVERAVFTVLAEVPSSVVFTGEWETGQIRLALKNIETVGEVNYLYDAAEVNRDLLEELTKLLLARPNQLRRLGSHQEMIQTTPRVVISEIQYPQTPEPALAAREPKGSLLDNLKSLLKR